MAYTLKISDFCLTKTGDWVGKGEIYFLASVTDARTGEVIPVSKVGEGHKKFPKRTRYNPGGDKAPLGVCSCDLPPGKDYAFTITVMDSDEVFRKRAGQIVGFISRLLSPVENNLPAHHPGFDEEWLLGTKVKLGNFEDLFSPLTVRLEKIFGKKLKGGETGVFKMLLHFARALKFLAKLQQDDKIGHPVSVMYHLDDDGAITSTNPRIEYIGLGESWITINLEAAGGA